ncbi:hypothetical protein EYF80_013431 [Liparis tanakae]|uniref:Uncharacterized protein n=1 Tax=Liparis tanakae TaxID=230148 RepID=A0A4Z2IGD3_9TELE|nr:hypothetical protein EYF80_013431 [Liparis tanakae]
MGVRAKVVGRTGSATELDEQYLEYVIALSIEYQMGACTHMAVVVQQVVGEFEFIEGDDLLHPLGAFGRRVRVVVHPARRGGVSFTGHQPRRAMEGIPEGKASPLDSRCTLMLATLGFFFTMVLPFGVELADDEEQLGVPPSLDGAWPGLDPG